MPNAYTKKNGDAIKVSWVDSDSRRRRRACSDLQRLGLEVKGVGTLEEVEPANDVAVVDGILAVMASKKIRELRAQGIVVFGFTPGAPLDAETFDDVVRLPFSSSSLAERITAHCRGEAQSAETTVSEALGNADTGEHEVATQGEIEDTGALVKRLCELSRARMTGVLHIRNKKAFAEIALVGGIVVGARDNSRSSRLLARMISRGVLSEETAKDVLSLSTKLNRRVAEIVVEMGLCSSERVVEELIAQAEDRVAAALCWTSGDTEFVADTSAAEKLAAGLLDLHRIALQSSVRLSGVPFIENLMTRRRAATIARGPDFDACINAYTQLFRDDDWVSTLRDQPLSTLAELEERIPMAVRPRARAVLFTFLCLGGIIRRGARMPRSIPRVDVRKHIEEVDVVQADLIKREWLRVQGRNLFEVMRIEPTTDTNDIATAIIRLNAACGRDRMSAIALGDANKEAREVWAIYDEIERLLSDEAALIAYVRKIEEERSVPATIDIDIDIASFDSETKMREARMALGRAEAEVAVSLFSELSLSAPADDEVASLLVWSRYLNGGSDAPSEILVKSAVFKLSRLESERGDIEAARSILLSAERCFPGDGEIKSALDTLGVSAPVIEMGLDEAGFDEAQLAALLKGADDKKKQEQNASDSAEFNIDFA